MGKTLLQVLVVVFAMGITSNQAQASYLKEVSIKKVSCGLFGNLNVKITGESRTLSVSKNGLTCASAKAVLKKEIQNNGNLFEADFFENTDYSQECSKDDGKTKCMTFRTTYRVYQITDLFINGRIFYGRAFVKKQRIR